jgi:hypothetical protein
MSANIRLGWKRVAVTNGLAYGTALLITAVKSFVAQAIKLKMKSVRVKSLQFFLSSSLSFLYQ